MQMPSELRLNSGPAYYWPVWASRNPLPGSTVRNGHSKTKPEDDLQTSTPFERTYLSSTAQNNATNVQLNLNTGVASEIFPLELSPTRNTLIGGGDFADVVSLLDGCIAHVLGDICGKGLEAAICVPQAMLALRLILSEETRPSAALARLNRYLCGEHLIAACQFVALSLVIFNPYTGRVSCSCAGSEPPLILRLQGKSEPILSCGMLLGVDIDTEYEEVDYTLEPGDAILLTTDGTTEARRRNKAGKTEFLNYSGVTKLATRAFSRGFAPGKVAERVLSGARKFAGGTLHDDACVLVFKHMASEKFPHNAPAKQSLMKGSE
jgi:serine phosphatase RsbU (regulator of sigma subunit)